jgi:hypothetical protein
VRDQLVALDAAGANDVGLVHINTVSPSATSSPISVANVFSSAYRNYRVTFDITPSTSAVHTLRLLDGSGQISGANYAYSIQRTDSATGATYVNSANGRSQTSAEMITTGVKWIASLDFISPFDSAQPTIIHGTGTLTVANSFTYAMSYNANASATGFDIILNTGTTTGHISVFGYRP